MTTTATVSNLSASHAEPTGRSGEQGLVLRARSDPDAYARLYLHHYPAIVGYLYRRTGDHAAAEDLAAETFLAAWRSIHKYQHRGLPFRAWLFRIATNKANARDRARRSRQRLHRAFALVQGREHEPLLDQTLDQREDLELLRAAMDRLSPTHKAVLALVHFECLHLSEVASILGVPKGTIKSRLSRARASLKRELGRLGVRL